MLKNENIQASQFMKMVCVFVIGTSSILLPTMMAAEASQDAWISSVIGMVVGLMLVLLYNALGRLFPGKNLVEVSKEAFGKWLGSLIALIWFAYAFILSALVLRNLGEFLNGTVFPETPIQSIFMVYLVIVVIGVRYGINNIALTLDIFFPSVLALILFFALMLTPDLEVKRIQPIFGEGIQVIMKGAYPYIAFPFLELVLLLMVFPNVKQSKAAAKAFMKGTLLGGLLMALLTLLSILVMGAESTAADIYSSFELAKEIEIGGFIQRVEAIITGIWFITIFYKLIVCFYISANCLSEVLTLSEHRSITLPLGMILYALGVIIAPNISYLIEFHIGPRVPYSAAIGLFLPLLILIVGAIRKKARKAGRQI